PMRKKNRMENGGDERGGIHPLPREKSPGAAGSPTRTPRRSAGNPRRVPRLAGFIPAVGFRDVVVRFGREDDMLNHAASAPAVSPAPNCGPTQDARESAACAA